MRVMRKRDKTRRGKAALYGKGNSEIAFVESIEAGRAAHQDIRGIAFLHECGTLEDSVSVRIPGEHDDEISVIGWLCLYQKRAQPAHPDGMRKCYENDHRTEDGEAGANRSAARHELLLVRGILLIQMADRL